MVRGEGFEPTTLKLVSDFDDFIVITINNVYLHHEFKGLVNEWHNYLILLRIVYNIL